MAETPRPSSFHSASLPPFPTRAGDRVSSFRVGKRHPSHRRLQIFLLVTMCVWGPRREEEPRCSVWTDQGTTALQVPLWGLARHSPRDPQGCCWQGAGGEAQTATDTFMPASKGEGRCAACSQQLSAGLYIIGSSCADGSQGPGGKEGGSRKEKPQE